MVNMAMSVLIFIVSTFVVLFQVKAQIGVTVCTSNADCAAHENALCDTLNSGTCVCATALSFIPNAANDACTYQCGDPAIIAEGSRFYLGTVTDSQAIYSCNDGFQLVGTGTLVCETSVGWGAAPTCEAGKLGDICGANTPLCDNIGNGECNGIQCACLTGYEDDGTTYVCVDIDECFSSPCQNGATCNDVVNGYTCDCVAGFADINCQTDIDECFSSPCQNGATCNDVVNGYTCDCVVGFADINCQTAVPVVLCSTNIDSRGRTWSKTLANTIRTEACNNGSIGYVTRQCRVDGTWQLPLYNCKRQVVLEIEAQVEVTVNSISTNSVHSLLETIVNVTAIQAGTGQGGEELLTDAELTSLSTSLETVAGALLENSNNSAVDVAEVATNFVESVSNLVDTTNKERWKSMKESNNNGAEKILSAVDSLGKAIQNQLKRNASMTQHATTKPNLAIQVKEMETNHVFPEKTNIGAKYEWLVETKSEVSFLLSSLPPIGGGDSYLSTVSMYRDMSDILPTQTNANDTSNNNLTMSDSVVEINGPVLAVSVSPSIEGRTLSPPIRLTFQHFQNSLGNPSCTFWISASTTGTGHWSDSGCWVNENLSSRELTVCECDHPHQLCCPHESSPTGETRIHVAADSTSEALRYVSIAGISISILCLCITIAVHLWFWKNVRGDRTTLLMNLCVALIISYVIFLAGIDRTEQEVLCKVVAAMLQYIYLVVFSIMLAEGIELLFTVLIVFARQSRLRKLLIVAWVAPAIIVGISLAATRTEGYGTDNFCWLSLDNGLIWAFVGPALGITLFNIICLVVLFYQMFNMKSMESVTTKNKIKTSVWSLCVLVPVMGLTWVIGIFYINQDLYFMQYLFAVANGLQGFFILLFHCILNQKIKRAYRLKYRRQIAVKESRTPNTRSTSDRGRTESRDMAHSYSGFRENRWTGDNSDTVPQQTMEGDILQTHSIVSAFTSGSNDMTGHRYITDSR